MFKDLTRLTVLACVTALAMTACDSDRTAETTADTIAPAAVVEPDQVLALYDGQERFVSAARDNPDAELSTLYAEYVIDPYWEPCFTGAVPEGERAEFTASMTLDDIDRLSASVAVLRAEEAVETVTTALAEARGVIDTPPVAACVLAGYPTAASAQLPDDTGGVMTGSGEQAMGVLINPEINGWQDLLVTRLRAIATCKKVALGARARPLRCYLAPDPPPEPGKRQP
jgi:hypothetical protein